MQRSSSSSGKGPLLGPLDYFLMAKHIATFHCCLRLVQLCFQVQAVDQVFGVDFIRKLIQQIENFLLFHSQSSERETINQCRLQMPSSRSKDGRLAAFPVAAGSGGVLGLPARLGGED